VAEKAWKINYKEDIIRFYVLTEGEVQILRTAAATARDRRKKIIAQILLFIHNCLFRIYEIYKRKYWFHYNNFEKKKAQNMFFTDKKS
jgi:hypothetical protein